MASAVRDGARSGKHLSRVVNVTVGDKRYGINLTLGTATQWNRAGFVDFPDMEDVGPFLPPGKRPAKRLLFTVLEERMMFKMQMQKLSELGPTRAVARAKAEASLAGYVANKLGWMCIDCGFDSMMKIAELKSLCDQIARSYASCRALPATLRAPLVLTSVTPEFLVQLLHCNCFSWSMRITALSCDALCLSSTACGDSRPSPLLAPDLRDSVFDASGAVALRDRTLDPVVLKRLARSLLAADSLSGTDGGEAVKGHESEAAPAADALPAAATTTASGEAGASALASTSNAATSSSSSASCGGEASSMLPIYLSADGTETLSAADDSPWPRCGTIVGGLVDRNRFPGAALRRAREVGARAVRLPIEAFSASAQSRVLTVVAVFQIVTARLEGRAWRHVLAESLPSRPSKRLELKAPQGGGGSQATPDEAGADGCCGVGAKRVKPAE